MGMQVMIDMRQKEGEEGMVRDDAVRVADHEQEQRLLSDCSTHVVKFTMISLTVTSPHPLPLDWQQGVEEMQ